MIESTVKNIVADRGFAFLAAPDDSGPDIFLHAKAMPDGEFARLAIGTRVLIETVELNPARDKNPRAVGARIAEEI